MVEIIKALQQLLGKKRIYGSEADFQFAFAWELKEIYGEQIDVRLEYTPWKYSDTMHIDIAVLNGNKLIPIELKYRKAKLDTVYNGEHIQLKAHTAHDTGAYEYLADIERLENLMKSGTYSISEAYAIILTNDSAYWRDTRKSPDGKQPNDIAFRIFEGVELTGKREWNAAASAGTTKGHERPIYLDGTYTMEWQDCSPTSDITFKYNVAKITSDGLGLHRYSKYTDQFKKLVAEDAIMPDKYKDRAQMLMPDDDDEAVAEYFTLKKAIQPYEHWNKTLNGKVYCRAKHQIVTLDYDICNQCPLLSGGGQGEGVDCCYPDVPTPDDYRATPQNELARITELIDKGILPLKCEKK